MKNDRARSLAEEIHNKHKIMEIELEVLFPMTGGYTSRPYDLLTGPHIPEAKDFKYLWRWWSRVFVNDGIDLDYTHLDRRVGNILGSSEGGSGKSKFNLEIRVLDKISLIGREISVGDVHHLAVVATEKFYEKLKDLLSEGYIIDSISLSIKPDLKITCRYRLHRSGRRSQRNHREEFSLKEEIERRIGTRLYISELEKLLRLARIRLLTMKKIYLSNDEDDVRERIFRTIYGLISYILIYKLVRLKLIVSSYHEIDRLGSREKQETLMYLKFLIVALFLGSIGAGSSRGFGSIVNIGRPKLYTSESIARSINDVYNSMVELIRRVVDYSSPVNIDIDEIRRILGLSTHLGHGGRISNVPMFIKDLAYVKVIKVPPQVDVMSIMKAISFFSLDSKKLCSNALSMIARNYQVWSNFRVIARICRYTLGSPRKLRDDEDRRRSSISVKVLMVNNSEKYILICGLLSRDITGLSSRDYSVLDDVILEKLGDRGVINFYRLLVDGVAHDILSYL